MANTEYWENLRRARCILAQEETAHISTQSITRQKTVQLVLTYMWQMGKATGNKDRRFHIGTASDGCSTSPMKSEKSARLTQLDAQDPHDTREDNARTADVTICIIPERTARSLSTVTVRCESQVVGDNVHCVIAWVSNVLFMVVHRNSDTELIEKSITPAFCRHHS